MKKALLFGANGYLGRHLAIFLKKFKIEFIPTGLSDTSIDNYSNYRKIDVTKKADLLRLDFNVDFVFVFCGLTGTDNSTDIANNFYQVNVQGLEHIIQRCLPFKKTRLIFPSTRLVYKGVQNTPLIETSAKETKTTYAKNKLACEKLLENSNVNYTIFRICVPYGNLFDHQYSYGTIGFFLKKGINGENIKIFGDGSLKRTFSHVEDIMNIILLSLKSKVTLNEIYNIGSDDSLSLLTVAKMISDKYSVGIEFSSWPKYALAIESGDTIFDDQKLKSLTAYKYKHSLQAWIETEIQPK